MIKDLLIVSYENPNSYVGLNTRIDGIVNALQEKKVHVEIVVPLYSRKAESENRCFKNFKVHQISMPNFFGRFNIPIFSRILFVIFFTFVVLRYFKKRNCIFNYVQSEQIYSFFCCFFLAKKYKAKIILDDPTMLELFVDDKLKKVNLIKFIVRNLVIKFEFFIYALSDYIFCSSKKTMDCINSKMKGIDHKLFYFPNGVDTEKYSMVEKQVIENKIFFNCSLPYYQNVAALKNIVNILEYFDEKKFYDYFITIIVNDVSFLSKDLLDKLKIYENVTILSKVESLAYHLQQADFVMLPYERGHFLTAGSRLKAIEALSCGKVVISTPEGIDGVLGCIDGKNVLICSDYVEMANRIIDLIKNEERNKKFIYKMQQSARNLVMEHYAWNKLIHVYDEI